MPSPNPTPPTPQRELRPFQDIINDAFDGIFADQETIGITDEIQKRFGCEEMGDELIDKIDRLCQHLIPHCIEDHGAKTGNALVSCLAAHILILGDAVGEQHGFKKAQDFYNSLGVNDTPIAVNDPTDPHDPIDPDPEA